MLGLGSSLLQGGALRSIVRSGLQLFYKADRTQAPLGEEQVKNNSFDEISGNLVSNPTFDLGSEAIQNGTFNLGSEEVQNGEFNELGSDKIYNGNFETGIDGWVPNAGSEATITYNSQLKGIKFSNDGIVGSPTVRNDTSNTVTGQTYKLTYKVLENNNASKISIWNGSTYNVYNDLPVNVSDDEHVYYYTFSGSDARDFYIKLETDESDITLSNIKLEQVDPNNRWTELKPSGQVVEIVNNQLHINYDASETQATTGIVQYIITPGKTYEISIDIQSITGTLTVLTGGASNNFNTIGVKTFTVTPNTSALYIINPLGGGVYNDMECYINSISVKEVTNWVLDANWSVANNTAIYVGDGNANELLQEISFIGGRTYEIKIDVASISGSLKARFNNHHANKAVFNQTGMQTLYITATGSGNITDDLSISREVGTVSAVLNSVSVKEVPNWELGDGWSIVDGKASNDGESGSNNLKQDGILTSNKSYQITIEVSDYVSGNVQVSAGGVPRGTMTANGTYTFNQVASGGNFYIVANSFVGSVDNVFVKQLDPNNRWTVQNPDTSAHTVEIREGETYINYDHDGGTVGSTGINQSGVFSNTTSKYEIEVELGEVTGQLKVQARGKSTTINSSDSNTTKVILLDSFNDYQTHIFIVRLDDDISGSAFVKNVSVREITNSIKDHSKNSNDGILYSGKALDFDGDGDGVQLNTAHDISILGDYTIALWFKRNNTSNSNNTIYHNSKDAENRTGVHWTADNKITFNTYRSATNYQGINSPVLDKDKWYRVVAVAKGGVKTLYINNENNPTSGGGISSFLPGSNEFLGGENSDYYCDGAVADFQLYDKAWNATDVKYDWENPDKDVFDRIGEAQVLGEEEAVDGGFPTGTTAWTVGPSTNLETEFGDGFVDILKEVGAGSTDAYIYQNILEEGKTYQVTFSGVINQGVLFFGVNDARTVFVAGEYINETFTFTSITGGFNPHLFIIRNPNTGTTIDARLTDISVKEVTTHASHILPTDCKSLLRLNEGAGDRVYDAAPVLRDEEVQNGTFNLGSEEVDNGDFATDLSSWDISGTDATHTVTYSNGSARYQSNSVSPQLNFDQTISNVEVGKTYQLSIDVTYTTGSLKVSSIDSNQTVLSEGLNVFSVVAATKTIRILRGANIVDALINSVSLKEVPNWTLEAGWSINNEKATYNGSAVNSAISQVSVTSGRNYKVEFTVKDYVSGTLNVALSDGSLGDNSIAANGTYSFNIIATGTLCAFRSTGSFDGSISNVSVKEIKPAENFAIVGTKAFIHQQPYIPQYAMSSFSKKMLFDGVNDYVTGSFNGNIGPAKDMTFSCWFSYEDSVTAPGDRETLFGLMSSSGDGLPFNKFDVSIFETNKIAVFTGDGTNHSTSNSTQNSLVKNKLNHLAVSVNDYDASSGVIKIYINGVLDTTTTKPYYGAPDISHYRIGSRSSSSQLSKGIIDEVSLFKSELTQDEVLELYNSGSSFDSTGHSKYNLGEEVSNSTFELGSEEVVNGDFSDGTISDWTFENLTPDISNNTLKLTSTTATNNKAYYDISTEVGKTYQVSADVKSGATNSEIGIGAISTTLPYNFQDGANAASFTTLKFVFTATLETTEIRLLNSKAGTWGGLGSIVEFDNISVKEIPDWSFANGWGLNGNTAVYDGTGSIYAKLIQTLSTAVGRTYQMTFTLSGLSSGKSVNFGFGHVDGSYTGHTQLTYSSNGTYTRVMQAKSTTDTIIIQANQADANFAVSNISVQEYGLSGYWRNNGADQWNDLSINSNHGTVSGSPTEIFLQEVPFFSKDSLGMFMNKPRLGGLNFNGSGYVANESMPTISDNISFSFWIKLEDFVNNNLAQVVGKRAAGDSRWCRVYRSSDDTLRLEVAAQNSLEFTIPEAEWVHVVTTIDESNSAIAYVNGALASQATLTGGFNFLNANDFSVGAWKNTATSVSGTSLLNGIVDDIMVYDETLTLKQVKKNYNATKGRHKN